MRPEMPRRRLKAQLQQIVAFLVRPPGVTILDSYGEIEVFTFDCLDTASIVSSLILFHRNNSW